jgi:hypothetical protein
MSKCSEVASKIMNVATQKLEIITVTCTRKSIVQQDEPKVTACG